MSRRVLSGGFSMEANTFAPGETTLVDLRAQVFGAGADLHRDFMGPERSSREPGRARGGSRGR
jgi:hypothetical protein